MLKKSNTGATLRSPKTNRESVHVKSDLSIDTFVTKLLGKYIHISSQFW